MNKTQEAIDTARANPFATTADISALTGCSGRTARRALQQLKEGARTGKAGAKILIFDIETAPMVVYVWGLYKQRINPDNVVQDWSCLSWAAKWLFEAEIMSEVVSGPEAMRRDDSSIMQGMWDLLNEADIIIAHNAARFDVRKLNARFYLNGMAPPMPYQVIDTLKISQRNFAFSSHKLDFLNQIMGFQRKIETDFGLWKRCVSGEEAALAEMQRYNKGDITALEELYVGLRPWIKSHPNMGLYVESDNEVCPNCGGSDLSNEGYYYTPAGKYQAFRCQCGAVGRRRWSDVSKSSRRNLTVSVAR